MLSRENSPQSQLGTVGAPFTANPATQGAVIGTGLEERFPIGSLRRVDERYLRAGTDPGHRTSILTALRRNV